MPRRASDQDRISDIYDTDKSKEYRQVLDRRERQTEHYRFFRDSLLSLTENRTGLNILDLGCGTGRHFPCLRNVRKLTGVDASRHMLENVAPGPPEDHPERLELDLVCGDIHQVHFNPDTFDLVYSIGTLGEYCDLNSELCDKVHDWLRPGGKFFFTAVDSRSRIKFRMRVKGMGGPASAIYPYVPGIFRGKFNRIFFSYYISRKELERELRNSRFKQWSIFHLVCRSSEWAGAHFVVTATK
jgi:SAM-dependent methyltransferase